MRRIVFTVSAIAIMLLVGWGITSVESWHRRPDGSASSPGAGGAKLAGGRHERRMPLPRFTVPKGPDEGVAISEQNTADALAMAAKLEPARKRLRGEYDEVYTHRLNLLDRYDRFLREGNVTQEQQARVTTALWLLQDTTKRVLLGQMQGPAPSSAQLARWRSAKQAWAMSAYDRCLTRVRSALDDQQWEFFQELLAEDLKSRARDLFVVRNS
jgi:hypothetical protein